MPLPINNPVTAFVLLENKIVFDCDSATLEIFQCPREDLIGQLFFQIFSPPYQADGLDSEQLIEAKFTRVTSGEPQFFPWRFLKADGSIIDTEISLKIKNFQDKTYIQVVIIDLNEKKRTNEALLVQKSYAQQLFENSPEAIVIADGAALILNVNRSFEQMFQYSYQEAVGQNLHQLIVPPDKLAEAQEAASRVKSGEKPQGESVRLRKDGSLIPVAYATFPIKTDDHLVGYYIIYNDISAYKEQEAKLKYISLHDPLTGLYNRACFEQKMLELQAEQPKQLGMIVCDIDGLKIINDTLGHKAGDELLVNTSKIIRHCLPEETFLARIGGDEFVIVLPGYQQKDLELLCNTIRNNIEFYNNMTTQNPISISLGYSSLEENVVFNINQLFVEADNNMYRDKICHGKSVRSPIIRIN